MRTRTSLRTATSFLLLAAAPALLLAAACGGDDTRPGGGTDFTTLEQGTPGSSFPGSNFGGRIASDAAGRAGGPATGAPVPAVPGAPAGRVADVQEADIYKLVGTRLYYFNTYRGFIVYDVSDAAHPVTVSRLPVYGYPVEMFVEGSTVYALLRDALYLSQTNGQLQFQRHDVSQLVTIDVADPADPHVVSTLDIIGQLHEGVSRKVGDTIYVVSEQWGGYYWGWATPDQTLEEQAWVYSYDVSDPLHPRQAGQLQIFQGGNDSTSDPNGGAYTSRWFSGVSISATANALMVVENWQSYGNNGGNGCGYWNAQEAVVSLIDISDPTGVIRRHAHFTTAGALDDQFKMTYRFDEASGRGIFYGIFAQQVWSGCAWTNQTQNTLETWDVSDGANPRRLATLDFGKPGESVRASNYDLSRNVVYAITARQIDPLYAIDVSVPEAPRVRSAIDGLSGSVSVFRNVGGGQFLLGVGQDQSDACAGYQDNDPTWRSTKMAVTIIDVRSLDAIKLVQRKCVAIQNADWTWSSLNWNLDQAHKMLGMFQDGDLNVITVPVSYSLREDVDTGWWYRWQTAVGLLTWDLTKYDPAKAPADQSVVQTYGTFVHPEGEVQRSILFRHPVSGARTMINLSDTHLSVADIQDLAHPQLQAVVEVAPPVDEIYAFGDYVVERVRRGGYWSQDGMAEFRVKAAGGPVDERAPVAVFQVGQATSVYRYQQSLVVLRQVIDPAGVQPASVEAVVWDLADPTHPRAAGRVAVPFDAYPYYGFYCGVGFWGGYWFGGGDRTVVTDAGLVQLRFDYRYDGTRSFYTPRLVYLDLEDLDAPAVHETSLGERSGWEWFGLVRDPSSARGFYLSHRDVVEQVTMDGGQVFTRYRYYAQRWQTDADSLAAGADVNLPGPLARTWVAGDGARRFLTYDSVYRTLQFPDHTEWHGDTRLNLLRQIGSPGGGGPAALLDARTFLDQNLSSFTIDGDRMFVVAQNQYYWWGYATARAANPPTWESTTDHLMSFDLSGGTLATVYDRPTRTYGTQLMGVHQGKLFVSLPGDGILLADVANPAQPRGVRFLRTLGWQSHVEFANDDVYVAAGNFGVFNLSLRAPSVLPLD